MSGSIGDVVGNVAGELIAVLLIAALIWFRDSVLSRVAFGWRWAYSLLTRKRYVLIWIDNGRAHARKLARKLHDDGPTAYRILRRPGSLRFYPLSTRRVRAVILLDTDVTKLADKPRQRERIETRLRDFVDNGGGLIGSHDLIYRRVRAQQLQELFGCQLTKFKTYAPAQVPYRLNAAFTAHPLRDDLPDEFRLDDGEICWGDWAANVEPIYTTEAEGVERPLVVAREAADGRLVWINSGDTTDSGLCGSIAKPQDELVILIRNAIRWVDHQT